MTSLYGFVKRLYLAFNPPAPEAPTESPLRFGVLGAARAAPIALIYPVKNHPDAVVRAVAARDQGRADAFAKKHGIPKAYGGPGAYQKMLDDPEIDVVYNPVGRISFSIMNEATYGSLPVSQLPNGLHYEWTMKALAAGKHVLLEMPSANTAEETRKMFAFAQEKRLVLLEAFHYRFHPATRRLKEIVDSGEIGTLTKIEASLAIPSGFVKDGNIRMVYELGGGVMMDMGCYTLSVSRYLSGADPTKVISAKADTLPKFPHIDIGCTATLAFPSPGGSTGPAEGPTATLDAHFRLPPRFGFLPQWPKVSARVTGTRGTVELNNFVGPWQYHQISVESSEEEGGPLQKRTEQRYGDLGWTSYRYQLEAFVDKLRGRDPEHWFDAQDSITNMEWIEAIYKEVGRRIRIAFQLTGLGSRPPSTAEIPQATGT
ncbi:NAD-P-binding protein [Russula ochroleuca]|uniref:D-xylose 1-dehydrogenase (NADP(+), D-xylono-1,5-lactone-forming) n=1 Tax=Russula ochroleuca TaxID=152965 RepID=A0A9P5K0W4_9AGAM|nr:NAD-P-binding protein [Russula ochroleuca]